MNEDFKQLAQQCGIIFEPTKQNRVHSVSTETLSRFAELIVRTCVKEVEFQHDGGREIDETTHSPDWNEAVECISAMILAKFELKKVIE